MCRQRKPISLAVFLVTFSKKHSPPFSSREFSTAQVRQRAADLELIRTELHAELRAELGAELAGRDGDGTGGKSTTAGVVPM